jgi:hypothetical protein
MISHWITNISHKKSIDCSDKSAYAGGECLRNDKSLTISWNLGYE